MFAPLAALLLVAAPAPDAVIMASTVDTVIPERVRLAEGLAIDKGRIFTGSVVDGSLWVGERGRWRRVEGGLPAGALLSLAVDSARGRLWLAIGAAEPFAGTPAFRGVVALDLRTLRPVARSAMPDEANAGDMAVAADGSVIVSDGGGGLYRCAPGCSVLELVLTKEQAPSPQGIAPAPDGRLYVADYERGLLLVDASAKRATLLGNPGKAELRGVDGLVWWRNRLIGVQNGTRTKRILEIGLDPPGTAAISVTPIEQGHPDWGEPTLAAIRADSLLYVADAQWEAWEKGGVRKIDTPPRPTPVRRLQLKP